MTEHPRDRREAAAGPDDLAIYVSRRKAAGLSLLGSFGVVISILAALSPSGVMTMIPAGGIVVPLAGLALCGILTLRFVTRLLSSAPILVVSHAGISVNSWLIRVDLIPWSQIEALIARKRQWLTRLDIVLRDQAQIRARQNGLQRGLSRFLAAVLPTWSVPTINDSILPLSIHELLGQMQGRYPHELALHQIEIRELR